MKSKNLAVVFGLVAGVGLVAGSPAMAASKLMSVCKADLQKLGCTAKTDSEAHECLEKGEKHDAKNDGFSHKCYEAHEAYEKKSGKEEKGEEHHDESAEHSH